MSTLLQQLDEVLKILSTTTENKPVDWTLLRPQNPSIKNISDRDWEAMRIKLVDEKMITSIKTKYDFANTDTTDFDGYFITFEGLLLLEFEGGYEGRYNKSQSESNRIKTIENRQSNYSFLLVVFAFLAIAVSVVSCWISWKSYEYQTHPKIEQKSSLDTLFHRSPAANSKKL